MRIAPANQSSRWALPASISSQMRSKPIRFPGIEPITSTAAFARICFSVNGTENLLSLGDILDLLVQRDEKHAQALASARAVIRTKRGRPKSGAKLPC